MFDTRDELHHDLLAALLEGERKNRNLFLAVKPKLRMHCRCPM
jgi:hypothetical protein